MENDFVPYLINENMSNPMVRLNLAEDVTNELPIESRTTLGYLCELRDQIERTDQWGTPCISLEIESGTNLLGRVSAYKTGTPYDRIHAGFLGPSNSPTNADYDTPVSVVLILDEDQMSEIATLNWFDSYDHPHRWTTTVPTDSVNEIINQINKIEEDISN